MENAPGNVDGERRGAIQHTHTHTHTMAIHLLGSPPLRYITVITN